jgi:hypothetical protein
LTGPTAEEEEEDIVKEKNQIHSTKYAVLLPQHVSGTNMPIIRSTINPLALSDPYMGRTAQLTSRHCILNIYSTNIHTEYFKLAA